MTAIGGGPRTVAVSVDMDAPCDYAEFYRLPTATPSDRFLAASLESLLELFAELGLRATFFAIARDATSAEGARWYRRAAEAGHEVANHSDRHPLAFAHLTRAEKVAEIDDAGRRLEDATGRPLVGFRAPAYDLDDETVELLLERGYRYDSSLCPSPFLPLMKLLVRVRARRWRVGLGGAGHLFADRAPHFLWLEGGRVRSGRRPWAGPHLVELPLAVLPGLRLPIYGTVTQTLGVVGFRLALGWLRRGRFPINYAFHAFELVGGEGAAAVPGYAAPPAARADTLRRSLALLAAGARSLTLAELAAEVAGEQGVPVAGPAPAARRKEPA